MTLSPQLQIGNDLRAMQGPVTDRVEGLHFHTMCEQNADTLERTLEVVEEKIWIP